ncbi:TVP38/TMEM64 family protein [Phormidium sp. CCY1219]|uniref:TVP38/TMEM64 family protein n=1 Tax=Phormidium sp. CCY1219 TaxID=2886104 RepID=UPI002D1E6C23|nr:TVP38/TMEM64 family protein [Phormidium sp. CCY1219]MEB3829703.1 TVP38/TMEM64 family protein [Phormidium sp. CCY1219]
MKEEMLNCGEKRRSQCRSVSARLRRQWIKQGRRIQQWGRSPKLWVAIALVLCLLVSWLTPLNRLFDRAFLTATLERWGNWAVFLFVFIYVVATVVGIPGTVMTLAGGAVFGLLWGTVWSVIGATLGAIGAFWVARYLLRDWAERRFAHHPALARFDRAVTHYPLAFVLAVRFAPISPFNVVNFLFGLTSLHWIHYAIGTLFGIIPGTLAYTWLGVTGDRALRGGDRLPFFLALSAIALLSVIPVWVKRRMNP